MWQALLFMRIDVLSISSFRQIIGLRALDII